MSYDSGKNLGTREIGAIRLFFRELDRNLVTFRDRMQKAMKEPGRIPRSQPELNRTASARAQGRYMGLMRHLGLAAKRQVRKVRVAHGLSAGIKLAQKLGKGART